MKHLIRAAVLAVLSLCAFAAPAAAQDNFAVKDATAATITKSAKKLSDGSLADKNVMIDSSGVEKGTAANPWLIAFPTVPTVNIGTMPSVTIASSALPAGAATATGQASLLTALGSPYQAGGPLPLPAGAATAAGQAANTNAITATQATTGTPAATSSTVTTVLPQLAASEGLAISFGTAAATLFNANPARHFIQVQVQGSTASCYLNWIATATADAHSLLVPAGGLYEPVSYIGTGAVSIICTAAATPVYSRQG